MTKECLTIVICTIGLLAACTEDPPPRSVTEFMENPILLDATMVRCGQNRAETKYDPECINARDAVERLAVAADAARREELEAQSERKRQALRRAQEAAAEARRRAHEAEQLRQQAEYLGQFGTVPADAAGVTEAATVGGQNADVTAVDGAAPDANAPAVVTGDDTAESTTVEEEQPAEPVTDLEAIREELQQRQEESQQRQEESQQ